MNEEQFKDFLETYNLKPVSIRWLREYLLAGFFADTSTLDLLSKDESNPEIPVVMINQLRTASLSTKLNVLRYLEEQAAKEREENKQRPIIYITVHSKEIADEVSDILKKNDIDHLND